MQLFLTSPRTIDPPHTIGEEEQMDHLSRQTALKIAVISGAATFATIAYAQEAEWPKFEGIWIFRSFIVDPTPEEVPTGVDPRARFAPFFPAKGYNWAPPGTLKIEPGDKGSINGTLTFPARPPRPSRSSSMWPAILRPVPRAHHRRSKRRPSDGRLRKSFISSRGGSSPIRPSVTRSSRSRRHQALYRHQSTRRMIARVSGGRS